MSETIRLDDDDREVSTAELATMASMSIKSMQRRLVRLQALGLKRKGAGRYRLGDYVQAWRKLDTRK